MGHIFPRVRRAVLVIAIAGAAAAVGCGSEGVDVSDDESAAVKEGAQLFAERCSGCHTLSAAGTQGSSNRSQRVQGPDFDQRTETVDDVIFAIRNGGFSGAIMPQNIVVGDDAEKVAEFVAKYAGKDVTEQPAPDPGP
jgi:mono/diheme cytochrome c family protein